MKFNVITRGLYLSASLLVAHAANAAETIKIGVLNDQSGVFADNGGTGSVAAAKLAVEDFGGELLGQKIEVISADHQNKPDIASATERPRRPDSRSSKSRGRRTRFL